MIVTLGCCMFCFSRIAAFTHCDEGHCCLHMFAKRVVACCIWLVPFFVCWVYNWTAKDNLGKIFATLYFVLTWGSTHLTWQIHSPIRSACLIIFRLIFFKNDNIPNVKLNILTWINSHTPSSPTSYHTIHNDDIQNHCLCFEFLHFLSHLLPCVYCFLVNAYFRHTFGSIFWMIFQPCPFSFSSSFLYLTCCALYAA